MISAGSSGKAAGKLLSGGDTHHTISGKTTAKVPSGDFYNDRDDEEDSKLDDRDLENSQSALNGEIAKITKKPRPHTAKDDIVDNVFYKRPGAAGPVYNSTIR